ncbi:MAG: thiamine pyrophosphate-dependent dehydrogenase E1 component subunit alpha [Chloroflexi bacterium]|nr:thiamine pyrophosphate-dependent dehydrogenase E1 component subunit alpha [Chloroflexota bacterium]
MGSTHRDLALALYRKLCLLRSFDQAGTAAYGRKEIHGTYRGAKGQEAVPVGVCHALRDGDYVFPSLRGIGDSLARGSDPRLLIAELFGKSTGVAGGRGGALHLADASHGVMGVFGVLAANVPMAAGAALAAQINENGAVTVCFFGDQASNEGAFHETMNVAALLKLPVLFVGINNAPEDANSCLGEHTAAGSMVALAKVHGIPADVVDATDVLTVYERAAAVVEDLRDGKGPHFLECQCFPLDEPSRAQVQEWKDEMRHTGQYGGMVLFKKSKIGKTELTPPEHWVRGDPVRKLEEHLLGNGLASVGDLEAVRESVRHEIDEAIAFARASPEPPAATAPLGVYAGG